MAKNLFKFFLILCIYGFTLFWANFALALSTPILISPVPDATGQPLAITLDWENVSGAEQYEFGYINTTQICDAVIEGAWTIPVTHPAESNFILTGLIPDNGQGSGRYCWKVKAQATGDESNWSEKRAFTTMQVVPPGDGLPPGGGPPPDVTSPIAAQTLEELFNAIITFLFYLVMALAPIMIIYAAFLIISAAGRAEQINKGKTIILWTLVAVAVALMSKGLPAVIKGALGG